VRENVCILVTGIPASGKSCFAEKLQQNLGIPVISKDQIKEILYDTVGFRSRAEKVALGNAALEVMYDMAARLMVCNQPFILENNFESHSVPGLVKILEDHYYRAVTVRLTGDYEKIYQRFLERDRSGKRHRGHVVNDCYPENSIKKGQLQAELSQEPSQEPPQEPSREPSLSPSLESFITGITNRGMDTFFIGDPVITVDTTDFAEVDEASVIETVKRAAGLS